MKKISRIGKYSGYSQQIYKEAVRTSQYVAVRDGTRLAVDIYRPSINKKPVSDPLPVCWCLTPYFREDGLKRFRDVEARILQERNKVICERTQNRILKIENPDTLESLPLRKPHQVR